MVCARWSEWLRVECLLRAHHQSCPVAVLCPRDERRTATDHMGRGTFMLQDLAALAAPAIVCAAFLVGAWALVRRELAPKRRARAQADADGRERERADREQGTN